MITEENGVGGKVRANLEREERVKWKENEEEWRQYGKVMYEEV